ncbi:MAG: alpha/beta fold hydrolase, partial [Acidimicrobiales bacterium]
MLTSFDAGRLFGQLHGHETPRVLALHGWRRDHEDWSASLATAGTGPLPALALDLPGFGATPAPEEAWGSPEYARAVQKLLGELAVPVILIGHSFGGRVAVELAALEPERVAGIVLTGAPLFPANPAAARRRPPLRY